MKKQLARPLLIGLLAACIPAQASDWVQLDKVGGESYLQRQGNRQSLQRTGPWAEFTQQWRAFQNGVLRKEAPLKEVMAVNCLTGAWSQKAYETTDPVTEERVLFTASFSDIEQGTSPFTRIDVTHPEPGLQANLLKFACGCQNPKASRPIDGTTLLRIYDTFIKEQTKEVGYRLRFMEFDTREAANAALQKIEAGASFAAVAAQLNPQPDRPGGDLGATPAHAWPAPKAQIFRKMKPGEHTRQPVEGIYGYGLYYLESHYEKPAEPFDAWKAAIETYAKREQSCGRRLF
ncbi:MAG: peptidyl-prolyl cis-trans isomerase [Gammaproteobacteria bacterium]